MHKLFKFLVIISLLLSFSITFISKVNADHRYGIKCDDNPDCVKCRDTSAKIVGLKCQRCMHSCWNKYGPAEYDELSNISITAKEQCRIKWAKWCNVQCWDPDETDEPDYVSSKPKCNQDSVFPKK